MGRIIGDARRGARFFGGAPRRLGDILSFGRRTKAALALPAALASAMALALPNGEPLPVSEAFSPAMARWGDNVEMVLSVRPGHYAYKSKFEFDASPGSIGLAPVFPKGEMKDDPKFGPQEVYRQTVEIPLRIERRGGAGLPAAFEVRARWQGCAEGGICYLPQTSVFRIEGEGSFSPLQGKALKESAFGASGSGSAKARIDFSALAGESKKKDDGAAAFGRALEDGPNDGSLSFSRFKPGQGSWVATLLAYFAAGLGLSFTACMYPLLPIVAGSVLGGQAGKTVTRRRGLALSLSYSQGLALTYTAVGVAAGLTGSLLTVWLQRPAVIVGGAVLIALLGLSMLGFFQLAAPASLSAWAAKKSGKLAGGGFLSVFLMGVFSALVIGPCVAPPLAFALGYIGATGDAVLGGAALYALAMGVAAPLVAVGTLGAGFLPKSGAWLALVQRFFGALLLFAAVYVAAPHMGAVAAAMLYAAVALALAAPALLDGLRRKGGAGKVEAAFGAALLAFGLFAGWQAWAGRNNAVFSFLSLDVEAARAGPRAPGASFSTLAELDLAVADAFARDPRAPVFVDFYADWCVTCREMAAKTLNRPNIVALMPPDRFFAADVTSGSADAKALLDAYGLYGPPGLFMLKSDGSRSDPILGFVEADRLEPWIRERQARPVLENPPKNPPKDPAARVPSP